MHFLYVNHHHVNTDVELTLSTVTLISKVRSYKATCTHAVVL